MQVNDIILGAIGSQKNGYDLLAGWSPVPLLREIMRKALISCVLSSKPRLFAGIPRL